MIVEWTAPALKRVSQIKSKYFSTEETDEYRIKLVKRIETKILQIGTICPSRHFKNTFIVFIDFSLLFHFVLLRMAQSIRLQH